jgi:hypothetical protein
MGSRRVYRKEIQCGVHKRSGMNRREHETEVRAVSASLALEQEFGYGKSWKY